jgi:hypothetical protein
MNRECRKKKGKETSCTYRLYIFRVVGERKMLREVQISTEVEHKKTKEPKRYHQSTKEKESLYS